MRPPLERYQDKIVEFFHDLTPLRLDPNCQRILRQFQTGHRHGLGSAAWDVPSLIHLVKLSGTIIAWKTLCFPNQLTGVYSHSQKAATRWLTAWKLFVAGCDPLISRQLYFGEETPGLTLPGDTFWRLRCFQPCESDFEEARELLTNVVYYDFDKIPEWLVRETQRSIKDVPHSVTFSIDITERSRHFPKPAQPVWKPSDDEANDD